MVYSDPIGAFSIIEINFSAAMQNGMQGFRAAAVQKGRQYAREKIGDFVSDQFYSALKSFLPIPNFELGKLAKGANSRYGGFRFAAFARDFLCEEISMPDSIWFEPQVNRDGDVASNGLTCNSKGSLRPLLGSIPRPDFIISPTPPLQRDLSHSHAWLVGELKLSTTGVIRSYIRPKTQPGQLMAILKYARKHTIPRVFVVGTLLRNPQHETIIKAVLSSEAAKEGIVGLVISLQ